MLSHKEHVRAVKLVAKCCSFSLLSAFNNYNRDHVCAEGKQSKTFATVGDKKTAE
jgi:hypothetical protein